MTRHRFVGDPHAAIALRDDLEWLADAWTDLLDRLGRDQPVNDGQPRAATRSVGLVINERVSEVMAQVTGYAWELANLLAVESTGFTMPRDRDTPMVLTAVAGRVGHFTEHPDPTVSRGVPERAALMRREVTRTAYPDGIRTVQLPAYQCPERVVDDEGRHVACLGHWTIRPLPSGSLGDMVCSADGDHRTPPSVWLRTVRRRARMDATADDLMHVLSGGTTRPVSAPAGNPPALGREAAHGAGAHAHGAGMRVPAHDAEG